MRRVDEVQQALRRAGLEIAVVELDASTATAPQAAAAVSAPLGSIVKTLLFMAAAEPVLVLVAGDRKAENKQIARLLGLSKKKVRIARADEVLAVAGCDPGGVPPVGYAQQPRVLIDGSLARFETVWAAAGAANAVFPISFHDLVVITGGDVSEIAAPSV